jgi:hypothetical protein
VGEWALSHACDTGIPWSRTSTTTAAARAASRWERIAPMYVVVKGGREIVERGKADGTVSSSI